MSKDKFKTGERVLVRAVIGPSGVTDAGTGREGVFVRVNTDDPEIWVLLKDVIKRPAPTPEKERGKP